MNLTTTPRIGRPRVNAHLTPAERRNKRKQSRTDRATAEAARLPILPDGARIKRETVELLLGCGQSTLWSWVKKGKVPAPEHDGRYVFWTAKTVRQMIGVSK